MLAKCQHECASIGSIFLHPSRQHNASKHLLALCQQRSQHFASKNWLAFCQQQGCKKMLLMLAHSCQHFASVVLALANFQKIISSSILADISQHFASLKVLPMLARVFKKSGNFVLAICQFKVPKNELVDASLLCQLVPSHDQPSVSQLLVLAKYQHLFA